MESPQFSIAMKKILFLPVLILSLGLASCHQTEKRGDLEPFADLESFFQHNQETFPASTLRDIYKRCFQDYFGPAHIIADSARCAAYIENELNMVDPDKGAPMVDLAGPEGNYVRVNLMLVKNGIIPVSTMVKALMRSCEVGYRNGARPITSEEWAVRWGEILMLLPSEGLEKLPNLEQDVEEITALLLRGEYVMHHSQTFNEAYNYHYRLIRYDVFMDEIFPLL